MDFGVTFHPVHMLNFADKFPIMVAAVQHGEYLAKKSYKVYLYVMFIFYINYIFIFYFYVDSWSLYRSNAYSKNFIYDPKPL